MSNISKRIVYAREIRLLRQEDIAQKMGVCSETVTQWEIGMAEPTPEQIIKLGQILQVSPEWLYTGNLPFPQIFKTNRHPADRLFDEKEMYSFIRTYCAIKGLRQSENVLPYARRMHSGQYRKGNGNVPYIYHPLLVTCHAIALDWNEDDLISTSLLHDVCEDCNIKPEDLPVDVTTQTAVRLLTKTPEIHERGDAGMDEYYEAISKNRIAILVKILDRCCNISTMAGAFPPDKISSYIDETERWIYPLLEKAKNDFPEISNQIFLLRYHMYSVIESLKHLQY